MVPGLQRLPQRVEHARRRTPAPRRGTARRGWRAPRRRGGSAGCRRPRSPRRSRCGAGLAWAAAVASDRPTGRPDSDRIELDLERRVGGSRSGSTPGQPGREHGLARPGRAEQEDVVPAGRGDEHGLDGVVVADDLGEVAGVARAGSAHRGTGAAARRRRGSKCRRRARSPHRAARPRRPRAPRAPAPPRRRSPVGTITVSKPALRRREHGGQDAVDRPEPPVEPELAEVHDPIDGLASTTRSAASAAIAIARSKPEPCFGSAAGERLTVSLRLGKSHPELRRPRRTRSRASPSAASGRPMMTKPGSWLEMSASTSTTAP